MRARSPLGLSVIEQRILLLRGHRVMLDAELASLYGVPTKVLIQAVKRNQRRFPADFMFRLTADEFSCLRSQTVTSKGRGGRRYVPLAFTEHGVAMLSTVLKSERAITVNIAIIRAFVKLRHLVTSNKDLAARLDALERKYDGRFKAVFEAIRELMVPARQLPQRRIGFGATGPARAPARSPSLRARSRGHQRTVTSA